MWEYCSRAEDERQKIALVSGDFSSVATFRLKKKKNRCEDESLSLLLLTNPKLKARNAALSGVDMSDDVVYVQ